MSHPWLPDASITFVGNAREFYAILAKLEDAPEADGLHAPARRRRMAQYLYKELRGTYAHHPIAGRDVRIGDRWCGGTA
jgi:hypothetical protein